MEYADELQKMGELQDRLAIHDAIRFAWNSSVEGGMKIQHGMASGLRDWEEKILAHALKDLASEMAGKVNEWVQIAYIEPKPMKGKKRTQMAENIHRWVKLHESEKGQ